MKGQTTRLSRPLIVGHGRDGQCLYDPEAKRELVRLCLQPGTSVAKVAPGHGINANGIRLELPSVALTDLQLILHALACPLFS